MLKHIYIIKASQADKQQLHMWEFIEIQENVEMRKYCSFN